MFLEILLTFFLIFILLAINQCWIKPRRVMKFYADQLKAMKYNPKIYPYKLFRNMILQKAQQGSKFGDPDLYFKTQYPKYDIVLSNIMNTPYIEFGHPDFLKDFYSTDKHYDYPKLSIFVNPIIRVFDGGLGVSEGSIWKKKRPLLNKLFNFDFIKMQAQNIVQICDRCIKQMEAKAKKGQDQSGRYVECYIFSDLLSNIFSSVILTGFLGIKEKYQIDGVEASNYLLQLIEDIGEHCLFSPTIILGGQFFDLGLRKIDRSINQRRRKLKDWGMKVLDEQMKKIQKELEKKEKNIEIDNIFKAYVLYKKQNNIPDSSLSNEQIFGEFLNFVFAGSDTTSNFLNVMICQIAKNPEIQRQLRKQIDVYIGNDDYSYENLKKFKYVEALQKEVTRTYGPVNITIPKKAINDNFLNGLAVKKGTIISVNAFSNHYSQKYFKQPMKFRPERWLNGECDSLDPFVLTGFGGGARSCIGKHLALLESKIALIKIMKRYKKIRLGKQDYKMEKKIFTKPEYFEVKLTIGE